MNTTPRSRIALVPLLLLSAAQTTWAQTEGATTTPAGVQWEVTSQPSMTMGGMSIPVAGKTHNVCAPANATEPPGSSNDERGCVSSDFARDGLTVTWTSVCAGPPAMTGQGELTYESEAYEAYSGSINYAIDGGTMVVALTGKRIGTCDNPM